MPSISDDREPVGVHEALQSLEKASRTPAKQRAVKVSGIVDAICRTAFDQGLDEHNLRTVVRIVSKKSELDQTSVTNLVKNLYPATRVPADVVVTVVGALGQGKGKPSLGTQNSLVKWLALAHEILEDSRVLSRLYGVLFGMLDMISIRTPLCHLLSLVTRRKHVKPFRIQQLLELSRGLGNEPALQGLLRVYRDYYPDIIIASTTATRNSFPPRPEPEWQKRLISILEASSATDEDVLEHRSGFRVSRKGRKRSKLSVIPDVHTFRANETSVTLEEIDSVEDFVGKLERIEPPGQMISFLTDPLLQKYVALKPSPITSRRIELWLSASLEEECNAARAGSEDSSYLFELAGGLGNHSQYDKGLLPIVSTFLRAYLPVWDGITAADAVLALLAYLPIQRFQDAYDSFLGPVEKVLPGHGLQSLEKLLHFYTQLLQHWIAQVAVRPAAPANKSFDKALEDLVVHVSNLSTSLLLSLSNSADSSIRSAILSFYELLSASSKPQVIPILLPPPLLAYLLAQSPSSATVSRICGIYANHKTAFDKHPTPITSYYPSKVTIPFNSCLRDFYNVFWGAKAFQSVGNSAAFFCHPALRVSLNDYLTAIEHEYAVGFALDLSHNPLLASLSAAAWWSLEDAEIEKHGYDRNSMNWHRGPVTQHSLEALEKDRGVSVSYLDYRRHVLQWMADRGCAGIRDLLFATHLKLKK
ncbi:Mis6-domain-containing protein [Lophiostoma macrostomum CBS 122681]|uniref:Mis6-domain-containing protein n=1 Tax=Lophiostoma macrostomum CBS 122681 TaxID=1314788 RepID=A0A6A6T0N4_9PLEO|nr:Mis6-domain-containing protein [Lophiostoma macrostomum CBS 122681]